MKCPSCEEDTNVRVRGRIEGEVRRLSNGRDVHPIRYFCEKCGISFYKDIAGLEHYWGEGLHEEEKDE